MSRWPRSPRARRRPSPATPPASIAVELIAAAQGVDYHAPLKTSEGFSHPRQGPRDLARLETDRYWADEMAALQAAVLGGGNRDHFSLEIA